MPPADPAITIRPAADADAHVLAQLAALDETAEIQLPALIAERDGRPVAARSLADGRIAADPFTHTVDVVELLELRAARLSRTPRRRWRPRLLRRRSTVAAGA